MDQRSRDDLRFSGPGRRVSLRPKILAFLLFTSLLFGLAAFVLIGELSARRVDGAFDRRASEVARALASPQVDGQDPSYRIAVAALSASDDVTRITIVDSETARVVASTDDWAGLPVARIPDDATASALASEPASSARARLGDIVVQSLGDLADPDAGSSPSHVAAIELDRSALASDLEFGRLVSALVAVGLIAVLVAAAHMLLGALVTRPTSRLATSLAALDAASTDGQTSSGPADEIARLEAALYRVFKTRESANTDFHPIPVHLPDMRILADGELTVFDCRLIDPDTPQGEEEAVDLGSLDDLFSDSITSYLRELMNLLSPGDTDAFEFSVGAHVYRLAVEAVEGGRYVLHLEAAPVSPPTLPEVEHGDTAVVLREILSELPMVIIEVDGKGVVRFMNQPAFGMRTMNAVGRRFVEIVPRASAQEAQEALRSAVKLREPCSFIAEEADDRGVRRWLNRIAAYGEKDALSIIIASVEIPVHIAGTSSAGPEAQQEEALWKAELRASEHESEIQRLRSGLEVAQQRVSEEEFRILTLREHIVNPLVALYRAGKTLEANDVSTSLRPAVAAIQSSLDALATVLDEHLDISLQRAAMAAVDSVDERFHLPTLLDEIAIEASRTAHSRAAPIQVDVQPILPKWMRGDVQTSRAMVHQMIEIARLVASDRPLVLAARQDASKARTVLVRFEVQIPPPRLADEALKTLRACIETTSESGSPSIEHFAKVVTLFEADGGTEHSELGSTLGHAVALGITAEFEVGEELETDNSWVRGLRTLIVQDTATAENGIQPALNAFGIIGYVVTNEQDLLAALKIAQEYSNPYRLVLVDVDTPNLEAFVSHLFDRNAPVVLVGKESESAMVGALSAGYNGYLAKPVRQVDLLEVILSTVEPQSNAALQSRTESVV